MTPTRSCLLMIFSALTLMGCSAPSPPERNEIVLPKGAVVVPLDLPPNLGAWNRPLKGFWSQDGLEDAPALKLRLVDTDGRYRDAPNEIMLELRCEPFARGMIIGAGAIRFGLAPPQVAPNDRLVLKADGLTLDGPVHPRTFGWTDTSVPGTFISADAIDLNRLAASRTLTVQWGARSASLPAPPSDMFEAFASRCSEAFRFAQWPR